ncbi:MAG: hypothetical protein GDA48_07995 [Hormoscilla sp. GM102CHS1]|nr:hypothetical protein [Hormoscilla sp. GM102CHS1]
MADTISQVIPFGERITWLKSLENSRNHERQADILGTRAIAAAGYAADGLHSVMQLFKQLQRNAPESLPGMTQLFQDKISLSLRGVSAGSDLFSQRLKGRKPGVGARCLKGALLVLP